MAPNSYYSGSVLALKRTRTHARTHGRILAFHMKWKPILILSLCVCVFMCLFYSSNRIKWVCVWVLLFLFLWCCCCYNVCTLCLCDSCNEWLKSYILYNIDIFVVASQSTTNYFAMQINWRMFLSLFFSVSPACFACILISLWTIYAEQIESKPTIFGQRHQQQQRRRLRWRRWRQQHSRTNTALSGRTM